MSFNDEERENILKIFDKTVTRENVEEFLNPEIFDFVKQQARLDMVCDRLTFVNKNKFRPYESLILTKFLLPTVSIPEFLDGITSVIKGKYMVFVDAHFLILCPSPDESEEIILKLQRASKASSINDTMKITKASDHEKFLAQFSNMKFNDFLNCCFEHHCELFQYHGSGLCPYCLVSVVMHIQKF